ncbi:MAG TPA: YbdK family carboxylate-amine ligase [Thermoleophilaceae bacterium]|nr:YbdK family carboxylate-amine ligase [Thermoleophilaceae bacterium]
MSKGGTGGSPPPHRFGEGEPFSVGLEEELVLVDAETLQLAHVADKLLARVQLPRDRIDHEAFLAEVEVRSEPVGSVGEAVAQLAEGRADAARAGAELAEAEFGSAGATIMSAGLHPDARLFDVELVQSERYERVERQMQGLIKRTPECALHVHVGLPDTEAAVNAMNGLREWLPLLHGLGANSPFWFGADSGMASSRAAVIRAYPGRGIPPVMREWEQYLACLDAVRAGGGPTDHTMVWWDARPQARLGTVELREVDAQTDLTSAASIAALARAIVRRAVEQPIENPAPEQALHWSSFRAARDGLDADIYCDGSPRPLREAARKLVGRLDDADPELEGIERIVREGNGADRQRAAHRDGGMPGLLRYLADGTSEGV